MLTTAMTCNSGLARSASMSVVGEVLVFQIDEVLGAGDGAQVGLEDPLLAVVESGILLETPGRQGAHDLQRRDGVAALRLLSRWLDLRQRVSVVGEVLVPHQPQRLVQVLDRRALDGETDVMQGKAGARPAPGLVDEVRRGVDVALAV
jgi:hypothetical protein